MTAIEDASRPAMGRRAFLATMAGVGALGLAACAADANSAVTLSLTSPLPATVPPKTELAISIITTELQLQASGQLSKLPFRVSSWPNLHAGPDIIEGFRAHSIDIANNAGIPPIQAHATGVQAKIVAVQLTEKPGYEFATAPGSGLHSIEQFRGKKIAFSQGQAQGVVVLRALNQAGISTSDVHLVPMSSTEFLTALEAKQVDVAPIGEPTLTEYLNGFARNGAGAIYTTVVDLLSILWAPVAVLEDRAKAAAIRAFIPFWARGQVWAYENPAQYIQVYYVNNQHLTTAQGELIAKAASKPVFPVSWDRAIAWEQQTADLLAAGGYDPKMDVSVLFDRRFEGLAASAVPAEYRG
ncbi:MAG TPA: ABC transporter substrate-binding protein [Streptosporangiaceae bacterium]|nr:ABC transporter substrate-binding protein [Streptosporangiaceae bacterium]